MKEVFFVKKSLLLKTIIFTVFIVLINGIYSYAEEDYDGYIVKLKKRPYLSLMSTSVLEPVYEKYNLYKIDEEDVSLLNPESVEFIEPNGTLKPASYEPNDEYYRIQKKYMELIGAPYAWEHNYLAEGVKIAFLDTGINQNHIDLVGRNIVALDYSGTGEVTESSYHGTCVVGAAAATTNNKIGLAGIAQADIYMMKIFSAEKASFDAALSALKDAIETYDCDVINMSVEADSMSTKIRNEFNSIAGDAAKRGKVVVASAGNKGENMYAYPAACSNIISVGSVDENGVLSDFSTYNDQVFVTAPGDNLPLLHGNPENNMFAMGSGTSFSAPIVSGAIAVLKGIDNTLSEGDIRNIIKYSATDAGDRGYDIKYGWGILNIEKMIKMITNDKYKLRSVYPIYDDLNHKLKISYFNSSKQAKDHQSLIIGVFDENEQLVKLSDFKELSLNPFEEKEFVFDMEIKTGEHAKVFCVADLERFIPSAETEIFYN